MNRPFDDVESEYFNWLISFISDENTRNYSQLLSVLYSREFKVLKRVPLDKNRASDGIDMRMRFVDEKGYNRNYLDIYLNGPCRILEMMVALSDRMEVHIMSDPTYGDRTSKWFWMMIENMDLKTMRDDHFSLEETDYILDTLLNREYDYYGRGALFYVKDPRRDMREVDIWYQMNWAMVEYEYMKGE